MSLLSGPYNNSFTAFTVKDSGAREQFASGMVRDTDDSKPDYSLVFDGPMIDRLAEHLTKGAKKYSARNWMLARGQAEYDRFRSSACRHFRQWLRGDTDEDHAAAVLFNINGAEYVKPYLTDCDPGDEQPEVKCVLPAYEMCAPCDQCRSAGRCLSPENTAP